jgi:hypothetical protein
MLEGGRRNGSLSCEYVGCTVVAVSEQHMNAASLIRDICGECFHLITWSF